MPVATNESSSIPQPRSMVRRKPAPSIVLDARYPCPDPDDPFAPLSVLRTRTASTLGILSFAGDSTSHLPTLPYTGGSPFPPDPYQTTPPTSPILASSSFSAGKIGATFSTRSTFDVSQSSHISPQVQSDPHVRTFSTPKRRRSRSAVSRKEARSRTCSGSPGTSPYGHTNLQAYVLASSRFPSPSYSAEPFGMQQTAHGNGSMLSLGIPLSRHDSAPVLSLMSAAQQSTFPEEPVHVSRSRAGKLARLLPKRTRSGLSLSESPCENGNERHRHGVPLTPVTPVSPKEKHVPEENTFHPRRKSSTLFPVLVATNMQSLDVSDPSTGASIYESTTEELGYMSSPSSTTLHSPSIAEPASLTSKKQRPQTMELQQRIFDLTKSPQHEKRETRPSTAPSTHSLSFDENALPTRRQLLDAASYNVVAENGLRIPFGNLFRDQKTVVIFIRHFWCPLCQDYMSSIVNTVDPGVLKQSGINLVIIGNGSYNMIKSYRQIFRMPYAVYTDPSSRLYGILGMTLKSIEPKPKKHHSGYVKHGRAGGIAMVIANALRVGMPIWEKGGDATQLGGEFVLGPGLTASYAHRMPTRSSHAPIVRVLAAAGVHVYSRSEKPIVVIASDTAGRESVVFGADEERWMEERRRSLARIRERKQARRLGVTGSVSVSSHSDSGQEMEVRLWGGRHIPDRLHASHMVRTDSIAEEEEEYVAGNVEPTSSPLGGSADVDDSHESTEDDTDHSSVDTRTLAGSDTGSEMGDVGCTKKPGSIEIIHGLSQPIQLLT